MLANGVDPQEIEDDFEARMTGVLIRGGLAADEKSETCQDTSFPAVVSHDGFA